MSAVRTSCPVTRATEPVGRLPLPDVERPVRGRRQVHGATRPLGATRLGGRLGGDAVAAVLPETGEALGRCGVSRRAAGRVGGAKGSDAGSAVAAVEVHFGVFLRECQSVNQRSVPLCQY
jgi:hypothetical protein